MDSNDEENLDRIYNEYHAFVKNMKPSQNLDSYRMEILEKMDYEWETLRGRYEITQIQDTLCSAIHSMVKDADSIEEMMEITGNMHRYYRVVVEE